MTRHCVFSYVSCYLVDCVLEPYFARVFRQRWYVISPKRNTTEADEPEELTRQGRIRRYALDRICHLDVTDDTFKVPAHLSAASYYAGSYGIIVEPEE